MNVPIRIIGVATTFFWIFLIAFFATAAYSVKDLQFSFGEPQISIGNELLFSLPVHVLNKGYYDIGAFNVTTCILDSDNNTLAKGSTFERVLLRGVEVTVYHNMSLNIDHLLDQAPEYLFNDSEFTIGAWVGLRLAQVIPVQAQSNFSFPWGAPFYGFAVGAPSFSAVELTRIQASVPVSFENHAFFDLAGNITLRLYNSYGMLIGEESLVFSVPQHSPYNGNVEFEVTADEVTPSGWFEVFFSSELFSYGPMVVSYG